MRSKSDASQDVEPKDLPRISTGSAGLDDILCGGLDANRMYLYEGRPGTGKTTLALQFLIGGVRGGERVLYISLSETERELKLVRGGTAGRWTESTSSNWSPRRRRWIRIASSPFFLPPKWS